MIQENKEMLLKDLGGRLSYGVKILDIPANVAGNLFLISTTMTIEYETSDDARSQTLYNIKPYLRPMSSMTEKEKDTFQGFIYPACNDPVSMIDWLNKNMFDYRGLISMGIALEAPKGMYKTE